MTLTTETTESTEATKAWEDETNVSPSNDDTHDGQSSNVIEASNNPETAASTGQNIATSPSQVHRTPSQNKCTSFPHGFYASLPALLSTFAWFLCLSQDGCDYARLTGPVVAEITNNPDVPYLDVGFNYYREPIQDPVSNEWYIDYGLLCQDYNTDIVDINGVWKFSKLTSFLSLVFGGGSAVFLWFSSCVVFTKGTWRLAGYEVLAATIFQAITFSWFSTSLCHGNDGRDKCTLYFGSKADLCALIFWFAAAICIFAKYPKPKVVIGANESSDERETISSGVQTEQATAADELPLEGHPQPTTKNTTSTPHPVNDHDIV